MSGVNRPIPVHAELTGIAVVAPTPGMIADQVMPDFAVSAERFSYNKFGVAQGITVPNTKVGRTAATPRVEFSATEVEARTEDHGLEDPVPVTDSTANSDIDPEAVATELTSQLVTLARELRVSTLMFAASTYIAGQITTYDANEGWYHTSSDPVEDFEEAQEGMVVDANTLTLGSKSWKWLRRHPKMIKAVRPANMSGEGRLSIDEVRDFLEIETILVGKAIVNGAKPGQEAVLQRCWGPHASLTYTERMAKSSKAYTFGATARLTKKQARRYFDANAGVEGSNVIRVSERLKEVIVAQEAGWLFRNAGQAPA